MTRTHVKSIAVAVVGCLLVGRCGYAQEHDQAQLGGARLLLAYNVDRKLRPRTLFFQPLTERPYTSDGSSWCLVINVEGRAIAWPDPNRPFDRITHEIGPQRLNALYRRVLEAGTDRYSRPLLTHPKAIDALAEIRPDRVRVLPSETEIAGVGDASYFTIGLGGRVTDRDPAKDNDTSASVRRSLEIMRPVYDEVLKKGKPEKVDYVRHWHWESTGRGEIVQYIVVTDGYFAAWDWGWAGRPSCRKAIAADTQAHLLAELKRTGLFDLKPVRTAPPKTMYGSITIIEARIDGLEIRAIPTPALTGILTRFRRNLEAPSGN